MSTLNREQAIRKAYYEALNGYLSYNSTTVAITDSIINQGASDSPVYVVFDNQTANWSRDGAFRMQSWDTSIQILIVSKQSFSVSKDIVDTISEQIENIITPTITTSGLGAQHGYQISCVILSNAIYKEIVLSPTATVNMKVLTFIQKVVKEGVF